MAEQLMIFTPGDRFGTLAETGKAVIWQISARGVPVPQSPVSREAAREVGRRLAGRRLASEREDLIARGADPSDLAVPLDPGDDEDGSDG